MKLMPIAFHTLYFQTDESLAKVFMSWNFKNENETSDALISLQELNSICAF